MANVDFVMFHTLVSSYYNFKVWHIFSYLNYYSFLLLVLLLLDTILPEPPAWFSTCPSGCCWWSLFKPLTSVPPSYKYQTAALLRVYLCCLCCHVTFNILINYLYLSVYPSFSVTYPFYILQLALPPNLLARTHRPCHNQTFLTIFYLHEPALTTVSNSGLQTAWW